MHPQKYWITAKSQPCAHDRVQHSNPILHPSVSTVQGHMSPNRDSFFILPVLNHLQSCLQGALVQSQAHPVLYIVTPQPGEASQKEPYC